MSVKDLWGHILELPQATSWEEMIPAAGRKSSEGRKPSQPLQSMMVKNVGRSTVHPWTLALPYGATWNMLTPSAYGRPS